MANFHHIDIRRTHLRDTTFRTNSDTETLVELISKHGFEQAISLLDGILQLQRFNFQQNYSIWREIILVKNLYFIVIVRKFYFQLNVEVLADIK